MKGHKDLHEPYSKSCTPNIQDLRLMEVQLRLMQLMHFPFFGLLINQALNIIQKENLIEEEIWAKTEAWDPKREFIQFHSAFKFEVHIL